MPQTVIGISSENPHYFSVNGRIRHLITSGEHYGALLNRDFDFRPYFQTLEQHGFNQTRLFSGSYVERVGDFNFQSNTLAPGEARVPIFADASGDRLHPEYAGRLRQVLECADRHGVVVEFVLFSAFYTEENFVDSPFFRPGARRQAFFNELTPEILHFSRLLLAELEPFRNVIVELVNEPYWFVDDRERTRRFLDRLAGEVRRLAPGKPVAWNVGNFFACAFEDVPEADVLNFHYMRPECVAANWHRNRPVVDDETGFSGPENRPYREEAWLALIGGAAGFSHLDMSYTVEAPGGAVNVPEDCRSHGGGASFRRELAALAGFLARYDFSRARPEPDLLVSNRRQAALALGAGGYLAYATGAPADTAIVLPAGEYRLRFFDPATAELLKEEAFRSDCASSRPLDPPAGDEMLLEVLPPGQSVPASGVE